MELEMPYTVMSGNDIGVLTHKCETATAAFELVKELQAKKTPSIKVKDREGNALTIADLERLSGKENI